MIDKGSWFDMRDSSSDRETKDGTGDGIAKLDDSEIFSIFYFLLDMAGAMMMERAQTLPGMEQINPKEYLAK